MDYALNKSIARALESFTTTASEYVAQKKVTNLLTLAQLEVATTDVRLKATEKAVRELRVLDR